MVRLAPAIQVFLFASAIFWVVTLMLHLHPENGDSKVFRNVGLIPQHYTTSQPRIFNAAKTSNLTGHLLSNLLEVTPHFQLWMSGCVH
jgi:hypothetical protein